MNIKITYGIHILLNMYHILQSINSDKIINVSIDLDIMRKNRNDVTDKYLNLYKSLVKEILKINNINIFFNNDFPMVDWYNNIESSGLNKNDIFIKKNNIFTKYENINSKTLKPYICINTKLVNSSIFFNKTKNKNYNFIDKYHFCKMELFNILNKTQYDIVLLGEKNIPDCNEYNFHRDNYGNYIMYADFINNLNNVIDETYIDSKDGYDLDNWKKTCYYLTHSNFNIFIGNSGGIHLYSCFDNCIQLGVTDRLLKWIPKENIHTNFYTTINTNDFLNKIKTKL